MDFNLSSDQQFFRETIRSFVDKEIRPVASELEKSGTYPTEIVEKMKSMGLESIEYQFDIVDKVSIENQLILLMEGTKEIDGLDQFAQMVNLYKNQQLNTLYELTISESAGIDNFKTDFLDTRNSNWIPIIEKSIKDASVFIAVGAGHLAGETGVISLLKAHGYTVTALKD